MYNPEKEESYRYNVHISNEEKYDGWAATVPNIPDLFGKGQEMIIYALNLSRKLRVSFSDWLKYCKH